MMAMTDKTPLGIRQKKFNLIELVFQDIFQLAIGYYNLNASRFYYAPVYQAYMKKSGKTEMLLFEYETMPITNLCGNQGNLYPDNMFFTNSTFNHFYHANNTWISLSAGLKIVSREAVYKNLTFYSTYTDAKTGNPYYVVGSASLRIEFTCQLDV
ncbi:hypothetical protein HDV01_007428 [Terramyces sp. JEL0728]|nr:hypothetical protein HDV01_007428 [Terramyces sp. JEL0728]